MTAQSKVGSLASLVRSKAAAAYKGGVDLLCVLVVAAFVFLAVAPLVHHVFMYWHSVVSTWAPAPTAQQKAAPAIKRASP